MLYKLFNVIVTTSVKKNSKGFAMALNILDIISKKRDGFELTTKEINIFLQAVVNKTISDSTIGAMLMALYLKQMNFRETVDFTKFMIHSGQVLEFRNFNKNILVDKHSTGGVGDKASLILVPALAACGLKIPMISGWALNYTGGTLDKLQSIPGFRVSLSLKEMEKCLTKTGCFICCATDSLCPADAILYKIRDVTATVDNKNLIVSSILSKKAAEGIKNLLVDVKFGKGASFKTKTQAQEVAEMMKQVGEELDLKIQVVLSEMNAPLGQYVGAALEVIEAVKCLRNEINNNTLELVKFLGAVILQSIDLVNTMEAGKKMIENTIKNKTALKYFKSMLKNQGVSESTAKELCAGNFDKVFPKSSHKTFLLSPAKGMVQEVDALKVGKACWLLGSGRITPNAKIDHSVGIVLLKEIGEEIDKDEPWIEVHHNNKSKYLPAEVEELLQKSLKINSNNISVSKKIEMILFK